MTEDVLVQTLAFDPPEGAFQDKRGFWRYGKGTQDAYGNNIGGNWVKGAPMPRSAASPEKKRYKEACKDFSLAGLSVLEELFYNPQTPAQVRVQIWKLWDERAWGKIPMAEEDRQAMTDIVPKQLILDKTLQEMLEEDKEFQNADSTDEA